MNRFISLISAFLLAALPQAFAASAVNVSATSVLDSGSAAIEASSTTSVDSSDTDEMMSSSTSSTSNSGVVNIGSAFSLTQKDAAGASMDESNANIAATSVMSRDDLSAFATASLKRDANMVSIESSQDEVSVEYREPARFLGFIPMTITSEATVESDGTVEVDRPWYRFLIALDRDASDTEAAIHASVDPMISADANVSAGFSDQMIARIVDAIRLAFSSSATANANTSVSY